MFNGIFCAARYDAITLSDATTTNIKKYIDKELLHMHTSVIQMTKNKNERTKKIYYLVNLKKGLNWKHKNNKNKTNARITITDRNSTHAFSVSFLTCLRLFCSGVQRHPVEETTEMEEK